MHHWGIQYKKKVSQIVCGLFLITLLSASFHSHDHHSHETRAQHLKSIKLEQTLESEQECSLCLFLLNKNANPSPVQSFNQPKLAIKNFQYNCHKEKKGCLLDLFLAPKNSPPMHLG